MTLLCSSGCLPIVPRVLMASHVEPWPAVEAAFLHVGNVVGNQIVAQSVAFVDGAPELAGGRVDGHAHAVADAGGVNPLELSLRA